MMNYDTIDISTLGPIRTCKAYHICLMRTVKVSAMYITAVVDTLFRHPKHIINTYTAVQQANKPIDVNNNIDKSKLFIKNENQKSF